MIAESTYINHGSVGEMAARVRYMRCTATSVLLHAKEKNSKRPLLLEK